MQTAFAKYEGAGNDFILIDNREGGFTPRAELIAALCDRHFGIGADGLIRITRPGHVADLDGHDAQKMRKEGVEWFMDYRNADGSLAEMCGNGTRAITLFAQRQGIADQPGGTPFHLGTRAGVKILTSLGDVPGLGKDGFQVEMGAWKRGAVDGYEVTIPGTSGSARGTFVDMGNPHVVAVLEDAFASLPNVEDLDLVTKPVVAPEIPSDQNVEFVRIDEQSEGDDAGEATMRVNERGCGETLSCGTGLCATAITLRAKTGIDHWTITVRGGTLRVDVTDEDVKLTGSATIVGKIELL